MSLITYVILDASGTFPIEVGRNVHMPDVAVAVSDSLTPVQLARMMLVDGEWIGRPASPEPEIDGNRLTLTGCPEGAFADVDDLDLAERLGRADAVNGLIEIELPDPGHYRVTVDFGRPYLPTTVSIEVQ